MTNDEWRMMNTQGSIHNSQFIMAIGLALFLLGSAHFAPAAALWDARLFLALHPPLRRWTRAFQILWHLGRTPFTLLCLTVAALFNLQSGVQAAIVFALIASIEWSIKRTLQRARPFTALPNAEMGQPRQPQDASFPSGDAMRIWFLALALPTTFGLPLFVGVAASILALTVCLGRVALGVHYPLDVLAGAGLGILGAGILQLMLVNLQFAIL